MAITSDCIDVSPRQTLLGGGHKVAKWQKFVYGLGHVHNDLCAAVWFSYMLFYLQVVLEMDGTVAGVLVMTGQVADALATPVAGWAVDRTHRSLRFYHATGTITVAVGFTLLFSTHPGRTQWWSLLYYVSLIILFQIGWALVQISHLAVITRIATTEKYRADLTTIRYTASVCCSILVYIVTWLILRNDQIRHNIGPEDYSKFKEINIILTCLGLLCSLIFYCSSEVKSDELRVSGDDDISRRETGQDIIKDTSTIRRLETDEPHGSRIRFLRSPITYQVSLMYMSSRLFTTLNLIYIPLYLDERQANNINNVDELRSTVASVPLVCFIASFITAILLKFRPKLFSDKVVYCLGCFVSLSGCIWISITNSYKDSDEVYMIAVLIGIGGSSTMVASLCLTATFATINNYKGGSIYSTVTFTDKLISGIVVLFIQNLLCDPKYVCPQFYRHVLAYAGCSVALLGLISLLSLQCFNPTLRQNRK